MERPFNAIHALAAAFFGLAICQNSGYFCLKDLNEAFQPKWPDSMEEMIKTDQLFKLNEWYGQEGRHELDKISHLFISGKESTYAPLYRHPCKIWGIGLNYK